MLSTAFSPCPNDIFLFRSFLEQHAGFPVFQKITIADIAQLNTLAQGHAVPLIKISAALLPKIADTYAVMEVGNIIGRGVGPLLLSLDRISHLTTIATPGATTTAHLLCRKYYPEALLLPMPYNMIIPALLRREVDAGVIIHEERFTYPKRLALRADLGKMWEQETQMPLPLGCLVIHKQLPSTIKETLTLSLQRSLSLALKDMEGSAIHASAYSCHKSPQVIYKFIQTYVNQDTLVLSKEGKQALEALALVH